MKGYVLVIDDNPMDVKIITRVVESSGFACFGFTEQAAGMEWLSKNTPKLIFLDLQMPEGSGYSLIPVIKKQAHLKKVPIVIISGKNLSEDVVKAVKLGASDYVIKPMDPLVVQEKIERTFAESGDYQDAEIGGPEGIEAFQLRPLRVKSFSEFGVKIISEAPIAPGDNLQITGIDAEMFGGTNLILRCLSCDITPDKKYVSQMTYVGMPEAQRQAIRKRSRQEWIKSRQEAA